MSAVIATVGGLGSGWLVVAALLWVAVAPLVGLAVGRMIRLADAGGPR